MKKWEYKQVSCCGEIESTGISPEDEAINTATKMAEEGWELISVYPEENYWAVTCFFKREIPDPPEIGSQKKSECCFCGQAVEGDMKIHFHKHHKTLVTSLKNGKRLGCEFGHSLGGWDICRCECHFKEGIDHCVPCCSPCPICGENIDGVLDNHIFDEHPEQWEKLRDVLIAITNDSNKPDPNPNSFERKTDMTKKYEKPEDIPEETIVKAFRDAEEIDFSARPNNYVKYRQIAFANLGWWLPLKRILPILGITPQLLLPVFINHKKVVRSYDDLGAFPLTEKCFLELAEILKKSVRVLREDGGSGEHFYLFTATPDGKIVISERVLKTKPRIQGEITPFSLK